MANPSPLELFEAFYPGGPLAPGKLALYTTTLRCGNNRNYWCFNLPQADRLCTSYRQTRRVRFGVGLQSSARALVIARERRRRAQPGSIRGCEASVSALPALWAEIPYRPDADPLPHGVTPAPLLPVRRQAFDLLAAIRHRPSIVVSTGSALCAFWLLDHLWEFDTEDQKCTEKAAAKALLRRVQWAIASRAADRGWRIAAAGDLAATFPVPGSPTGTGAKGPRAVLEAFPLVSGDGRYRRGDFESLPEPPADDPQAWRELLERPSSLDELERRTFDFRPIADGCSWIRHCLDVHATLDKEELQPAIELLRWCSAPSADNRQLIHELCGGHPGYDPFAVDQQLAALLRASDDPITCRQIGKPPGIAERHCSSCPHFGLIDSPVELDRGDSAAAVSAASAGEDSCDTLSDSAPSGAMSRLPPSGGTPKEDVAPAGATAAGASPQVPTSEGTRPLSPSGGRPRILITCRQHEVNDQALAALAMGAELFERAGALVELVRAPGAGGARWIRVQEARLQELLSRHCDFVSEAGERGGRELRGAHPPRWTMRALLARGRWPELPQLGACPSMRGRAPGTDGLGQEVELQARVSGAEAETEDRRVLAGSAGVSPAPGGSDAAGLLAGLEEVLDTLDGPATARRVAGALAADPERFPALGAAFERFWPKVEPGDAAAAAVLGYRLRSLKDRVLGGRALVEARRTRDGIAWAVRCVPWPASGATLPLARRRRDTQSVPPPTPDHPEEASP